MARVKFKTFGCTYGWSDWLYYCGDYVSWMLDFDGKRHFYGGAAHTRSDNSSLLNIRKAWKTVHRLRRMGFQAELERV